jgi:hypothetical protein
VQYIYQLEQEKTQLLTRNCELKRRFDQVSNRETCPSDGSQSSGTPSPAVTVSAPPTVVVTAAPAPILSNPTTTTNQQQQVSAAKREYLNQMHLPPLKRKRAYVLAEAEAEAQQDPEGEKRARNIASVVAAVGNAAAAEHAAANNNNVVVTSHSVGVGIQQHDLPDNVDTEQKPIKHVVLAPASSAAQQHQSVQQVYIQQSNEDNTLHHQVAVLQRELDQERGYRLALEDKTRSLEAKVHTSVTSVRAHPQTVYQQVTQVPQQVHHMTQVHECSTPRATTEVATHVEAPVAYSRVRLAPSQQTATYRLAKVR